MAFTKYVAPDYVLKMKEQLRLVRMMPVIKQEGPGRKKAIPELSRGDYLEIQGVTYLVAGKSLYREGKWKWHELHLVDLITGNPMFLEYEQDDSLETALWETGELELSDLGLTEKMLVTFDDDEQGRFVFGETTFTYDESDKAFWTKGSDGEETPFYYWDFVEKKGKKMISVEKWEDGSFDVSTGTEIDPRTVIYLTTASEQR